MTGARGDALDWALALARAPGERLVLRQRRLPEGIDALLQIAAGSRGESLEEAVSRSGIEERELVEAVRFYLREVLFHSTADAYRILGLERGASPDQIKGHHRLLQQWLHPDRHTSDWDAIFAGRVNAAWNQLRNEERRRAYAEENPVPVRSAPLRVPLVTSGWMPSPPPESARYRWQRRAPLLGLMVACAGLGVMAVRDLARDDAMLVAAPVGSAQPQPLDPRSREDARLDAFGKLHLPERATAARRSNTSAVPGSRARPIDRLGAASQSGADPAPRSPVKDAVLPRLPVNIEPPLLAEPRAEKQARVNTKSHVDALPRVVAKPVAKAGVGKPVAELKTAVAAPPVPAPGATAPASTPRTVQPPPKPKATVATVATATSAPPVVSSISAERVSQAEQVGDRLLGFMSRAGAASPPIWDSPAAQKGAQQLRVTMLGDGRPKIDQANWRVGESEAKMRVAIRHTDGRQGHLDAVLVWREERWLVRRLSMERDW